MSEGAFDRDVHDLGGEEDVDHDAEVGRLFTDAVERQIGEHRELGRLLEGLSDRLDRLDDRLDLRGSEVRDALDATVGDAVEAATARLRDEVSQQLQRIEQRVDRLLGAGLAEAGLALGDELTTLRARVALARDDRRSDLKVANRVRLLEDRLDRTREAVEDLGRQIEHQLADHRAAMGEELSGIAERLSSTTVRTDPAQRAELIDHLDPIFDERMGDVRRASVRLEEEVGRLGGQVRGMLSNVDERIEGVTGSVGEVVTALHEIARRLAVVGDATRLLLESAAEDEEEDVAAPVRRPSGLARVLGGYSCPRCGHVARTERGLAKHRRTHTEGS